VLPSQKISFKNSLVHFGLNEIKTISNQTRLNKRFGTKCKIIAEICVYFFIFSGKRIGNKNGQRNKDQLLSANLGFLRSATFVRTRVLKKT